MSLRALGGGTVSVDLPELRVSQAADPIVVRLRRAGRTNWIPGRVSETRARVREGDLTARRFFRVAFDVSRESGDPTTWSGVLQVEASNEGNACTSGRRPVATLELSFAGRSSTATSTPATLAGRWYRIFCTCNNEYQIVDAELRACNGGGVGQGLRCGQLAGAADSATRGPGAASSPGSRKTRIAPPATRPLGTGPSSPSRVRR